MKRIILAAAAIAALSPLAACHVNDAPTADQQATAQQEDLAQRAQDEIGIYKPTHFTRKREANLIGQMLDDPNLATISYAQGMDGRLRCIGHTVGFPLPGGTQTTAPETFKWIEEGYSPSHTTWNGYTFERAPQAEPDQLFYPSTSDGTWIMLVSSKGQVKPAYFEGKVQAFPVDVQPDPSLIAQACSR
jgi:hypothetical protein